MVFLLQAIIKVSPVYEQITQKIQEVYYTSRLETNKIHRLFHAC
jgi:hypothetical protein